MSAQHHQTCREQRHDHRDAAGVNPAARERSAANPEGFLMLSGALDFGAQTHSIVPLCGIDGLRELIDYGCDQIAEALRDDEADLADLIFVNGLAWGARRHIEALGAGGLRTSLQRAVQRVRDLDRQWFAMSGLTGAAAGEASA